MNVFDGVPEPHRSVLIDVLGKRAPDLLAELGRKREPSPDEWDVVTETLDDAANEHLVPGRDPEMDERGLSIDHAMGAFINAFIHVNDRERGRESPPA